MSAASASDDKSYRRGSSFLIGASNEPFLTTCAQFIWLVGSKLFV